MKKFGKVAIVGVGLIGGSIGLCLKQKRLAYEVIGIGRRRSSIYKAIKLKAIDYGTLDLKKGVLDADIIILATPVLSIVPLAKKLIPYLKRGCIVTDVGSTKSQIVKELELTLPKGVNFVGAHPMAGSEKKGVKEARPGLFEKSICILTKTVLTNRHSLRVMKEFWNSLGAKVVVLSPEVHDRVVSEVSHLPHMVIFSMLDSVDTESLRFASSGFYDTTRIASSDAEIWRDIAISNKTGILRAILRFKKRLSVLERAIKEEDGQKLMRIFKKARSKRESCKFKSKIFCSNF